MKNKQAIQVKLIWNGRIPTEIDLPMGLDAIVPCQINGS